MLARVFLLGTLLLTSWCRTDVKSAVDVVGVGSIYHSQEEVQQKINEKYIDLYDSDTVEDALDMLNRLRYIAGVSDNIVLSDEYNQKATLATQVTAANGYISHHPLRPSDMQEQLWQLGSEGCHNCNLTYNSSDMTLVQALRICVDDRDAVNRKEVGHRRWMLNPGMTSTGFGVTNSSGTYTAIWATDNPSHTDGVSGIIWPACEMPVEYFSNSTPWSYSYGEDLYNISVTLESDNQTWRFSDSSSDGSFYVSNKAYGLPGCVTFVPDGIDIQEGQYYTVTIYQDGALLATYPVHFF